MTSKTSFDFTIQNFNSLISEKTKDFVGRKWVFDEIDNWLSDEAQNKPKYFIITGKAGYGKSAIAARLIEISSKDSPKNNDKDNRYYNFNKIKKGFLDACYVISFKDNLSTDAKSLTKSISNQLASKYDGFAQELFNSTRSSTNYDIKIDNTLKENQAKMISGGIFTFNINGSPSAVSVFNDLIRTPLESFLKKNPQKKMVFLIDGLDESITSSKDESDSDSIISILSNLDALKNVYFILTTRDYENILNKFKDNSLKLDLSSMNYIDNINKDISSFINLNIDKNKENLQSNSYDEKVTLHLIEKVEGNFLYIKFVIDAVNENKIAFSLEEIDNMPSGLFGMYNLFFDRMAIQYGKDSWKSQYKPIIRTLLVSFEGFDTSQISFFTRIERDDLSDILIDLKPFIVSDELSPIKKKYKLYHQSLVEFLKKEYLDDDSINTFFISEQDAHRKIAERFYDESKDEFKINLLNKNEYGLKYLPDHLFALINYDDYEGIEWYAKLLQLVKDNKFEEKQLEYFPFETDLPLKTIKRAFESSLEKEDPMSTGEMFLLYSSKVIYILKESPLSILKDFDKDSNNSKNNYVLEKACRIADLYEKETRVTWYLLLAWFLDYKNDTTNAKKTLDNLFKRDMGYINNGDIINHLVYFLYPHYKSEIVKIFEYLSNNDVYKICSLFIKDNKNNLKIGLEVFRYVKNKNTSYTNAKTNLELYESDIEGSLISQIIDKSNFLSDRLQSLLFIASSLAQAGKIDEAIKTANEIENIYDRLQVLSSIASSLAQAGKIDEAARLFDEAINVANAIENIYDKSKALSPIASALAQAGKIDGAARLFDEAIKTANELDDNSYYKPQVLSSIASSLAQAGKIDEAIMLFDEAIKTANEIDDNRSFKSQTILKIILTQLEFEKSLPKDLLEMVTANIGNSLYEIVSNLLNAPKDLWNYLMKQCIGYPEISYSICSLIAKRYPQKASEIADLILKHNY